MLSGQIHNSAELIELIDRIGFLPLQDIRMTVTAMNTAGDGPYSPPLSVFTEVMKSDANALPMNHSNALRSSCTKSALMPGRMIS